MGKISEFFGAVLQEHSAGFQTGDGHANLSVYAADLF